MQPLASTLLPPLTLAASHAGVLVRRLGQPLLGGNRVDLLNDGPATFDAIFRAIDAARDHINIESYIVEDTGPGEELAQRLEARCREGVRVNLLFDSFGSLGTSQDFFERLRAAGVKLCEYNPVRRWQSWLGKALHLRDHRKLIVVDGRVGFIGGVNISKVYSSVAPHRSDSESTAGWRDLHLRLEGPAVASLQRLFVDHWLRFATCPMAAAHYFPPLGAAGQQRVAVAASDAGRRRNPFFSALLAAIDAARNRVLLTTAYLVPPRRLINALVRAARRGVSVELMLPGRSDFWAPLHAGRSHYSRLLREGIRIHERRDRLLHAKACVIDGVWSSVGSSNVDWRSLLHNAEADLLVLDEGFARQLEQVFREDRACANSIEAQRWAQRSFRRRWQESVARQFEALM